MLLSLALALAAPPHRGPVAEHTFEVERPVCAEHHVAPVWAAWLLIGLAAGWSLRPRGAP